MAGSHRAERPETVSRKPSRTVLIVVIVALIPAIYFGAHQILSRSATAGEPGNSNATRVPTVSPTSAAPTPTVTPTVTAVPPPVRNPLPRVKPNAPRRLIVASVLNAAFNDSIQPQAGLFTPAATAEVARWGTRGSPGSPGTDTVYVVGKIAGPTSAFGRLGSLHAGNRIVIRTDSGLMTYTVRSLATRRANGLITNPTFRARVPGRLILIGIEYSGPNRTSSVLVVTAQLSGARRV